MNGVQSSGERAQAARVAGDDALPLLRTKLHRPVAPPGIEARPRLLQRLEGAQQRALTLISAPAGYGKTMLASAWLSGRQEPVAWVSLDERDDDLLTFASYLVAAAHAPFPSLQFKTQTLLQAPVPPSASTIARYFAGDLEQASGRLLLALDDIHLLRNPAVFDLLAELLRHPSPHLHLVLIGRRDPPLPIATLRAKGEVVEVRARDLQFTPPETARLLGGMLHRDVDEATAIAWTERTEGWVTALRLVALSLVQRYGGDALSIDAPDSPQYVQEYLLADVLAHLPAEQRSWLLKTAMLDRFCAPLCEAICSADAGNCASGLSGKAFIRWLQDDNLFLVSLDDQGRWFRFHHLFRDLLRDLVAEQHSRDEAQAVYRQASAWFSANGLTDEAIQYALAGSDSAAAACLVEQGRYALMNTEQWARLGRWLRMLPEETVNRSALLTNARGFLAVQRGEESETLAALERSARLLAGLPPESGAAHIARAELDALSYLPDFMAGWFDRAVANARRSLASLPMEALHVRSLATSIEASALHLGGAPAEALAVLEAALADPSWPRPMRARLLYYLCTEHYLCGNLRGVLAAAAECVALAVELQHPELAAWGLYYLGAAHYARNDFEAAEPHLVALVENKALAGPVTLAFGVFALALIRQAQGRADEADALVETLGAYLQRIEHKLAAPLRATFGAELALRRGEPSDVLRVATSGYAARLPRWYFYAPQLTEIKLLLCDGRPESVVEAQRQLHALEEEVRRLGVAHTIIDVLVLQALTLRTLGDEPAAFDRLSEALERAEPGGFIRPFVDIGAPIVDLLAGLAARGERLSLPAAAHLARVVSAFTPPRQARPATPARARPAAPLIEPLTQREEQLLRLVATDLSPLEIASSLSLSPTTVRTHIRNIYAKLDAHSRYEAVMRARELGLI